MKRTLVIALVAIAALYLALGQAIANNQAAGNANVQEELKRLENDRAQAVLKGDTAALDRMTADDYTVINISGQLLTKAQVLEAIKSGDLKYDQLENNDLQVRVYGVTAVLTGRTAQKGQFKGKDISGQTRFTRVYLKQHGKWQAVAFQATRIAEQRIASEFPSSVEPRLPSGGARRGPIYQLNCPIPEIRA